MQVLYIGENCSEIKGGAMVINQRNQMMLYQTFGEQNVKFIYYDKRFSKFDHLPFYYSACIRDFYKRLEQIINKCNIVFISHSILGKLTYHIKCNFPKIKIIVFFHNIEKYYAQELIRVDGFRHSISYIISSYNENLSVKYSDYRITLNSRDTHLLSRFYNVNADLELPTSFVDTCIDGNTTDIDYSSIKYLFVGNAFFANIEGVKWFVSKVLPFIPGKLIVVGSGMNILKNMESKKMEIYDYVEDLSQFYYNADLVVAPIFSGGGMKTKTAEALMYGKTVLGTNEALEGYVKKEKAIYSCNSDNDFIVTIQNLIKNRQINKFNEFSRELFLNNYSIESTVLKFKHWINQQKI